MANRLDDGNYSTGFQVGPPRITWPFLGNPTPDKYARLIDRDWAIIPANYVPAVANRTAYSNLLTYSEDFTNAAWTLTALSTPTVSIANPADGLLTANLLSETSANSEHRAAHAFTFTAVPTTFSVCVKGLVRAFAYLRANDGTTDFSGYFSLSGAGTVGTLGANTTGAIVALGDGWYRVSITFTPAAAAGNVYANVASGAATISYAGNTGDGLYMWGAQVEAAAFAGPYISTTTALRSILAPDLDPGDGVNPADPFAYLLSETTPMALDAATARAKFVRRWGRIPKPQAVGGSTPVSKPNIPSSFAYATRYLDGVAQTICNSFRFAEAYSVDGSSNAYFDVYSFIPSTAGAQAQATGGTFTWTYKTSTAGPFNYNDSGVTIAAAINALASIISDGINVQVINQLNTIPAILQVSKNGGNDFAAAPTMNASSLTPAAAAYSDLTTNTASTKTFSLREAYTMPTAGIVNTGQNFATGSTVAGVTTLWIVSSANWTVADANTIVFPYINSIVGGNHAGPFLKRYTPGSYITRCVVTSNFYLPGVTRGITTPDDIPIPAQGSDPYTLLKAIFGNTGAINYVVGQEKPWQGPIYQVDITTVNSADL